MEPVPCIHTEFFHKPQDIWDATDSALFSACMWEGRGSEESAQPQNELQYRLQPLEETESSRVRPAPPRPGWVRGQWVVTNRLVVEVIAGPGSMAPPQRCPLCRQTFFCGRGHVYSRKHQRQLKGALERLLPQVRKRGWRRPGMRAGLEGPQAVVSGS